ncbi:MAG: type II toxin-antitoxin system MqsR family toxin [Gemmatimonadetes bacterium]|nr:type II toxin-antitoxin system MqsR family toxin [Gemmatimonadota bacterium]
MVHLLARLKQISVTGKARSEALAELPRTVEQPSEAIRKTLLDLTESHWKFSEQDERGWVDVYRILKFNRLLWVKIKLEKRFAKETVIVISFHHFDDEIQV